MRVCHPGERLPKTLGCGGLRVSLERSRRLGYGNWHVALSGRVARVTEARLELHDRQQAAPPNKGMKLTKPGELRSFAAYPRCSADIDEVAGATGIARVTVRL